TPYGIDQPIRRSIPIKSIARVMENHRYGRVFESLRQAFDSLPQQSRLASASDVAYRLTVSRQLDVFMPRGDAGTRRSQRHHVPSHKRRIIAHAAALRRKLRCDMDDEQ